jgi:hypothetical protein
MKQNTFDLSAKLLATENISVVRAPTSTASFDIKNRTLTLPNWKDTTPEIESMLIGHEVGHALFTDVSYIKPIKENPALMSYMNILEDVRVEKLIKRLYPGIRKTMTEGYRQLNQRDFFGIKSAKNLNTLLLIDKLNLYFKVGFDCGVTFTPKEKQFVNRAENTETIDDIISLANEIREYSKHKNDADKREFDDEFSGDDSDYFDDEDEDDTDEEFGSSSSYDDDEDDEDEYDDDSDRKSSRSIRKPKIEEEDLEAKTADAFDKKLASLADSSVRYTYYELESQYKEDPIVGYKTILNETKEVDEYVDSMYISQFKQETDRVVSYLVKEFEMRKSATLYKRAQTSKSGSLDMGKVWSYKLNDDLFKRVTTIPAGKNHGMVFLLDWSGSMIDVIQDTIKQVINLAMFCQRANIPYQVFAFTSYYKGDNIYKPYSPDSLADKQVICNNSGTFNLLELFSDKMSSADFNTMIRRTLTTYSFFRQKQGGYSLGGTPLNEALVYMYNYIDKFIKNRNIEKMTLITLTDGEGGELYSNKGRLQPNGWEQDSFGRHVYFKNKHFVRDIYTKKNYEFSSNETVQTCSILNMIKDRYRINVVGFYICNNNSGVIRNAINNNIPEFRADMTQTIVDIRKEFKEFGYASLTNAGRDELFLVPASSTKINDGEIKAASDMSAAAIARNFSKFMGNKKTSRVLLNKFIGYVA